jgi:hypothetical protein
MDVKLFTSVFLIGYLTASFNILSFTLGAGLMYTLMRTDLYGKFNVYCVHTFPMFKKIIGQNGGFENIETLVNYASTSISGSTGSTAASSSTPSTPSSSTGAATTTGAAEADADKDV